jgi:hypothetical protein
MAHPWVVVRGDSLQIWRIVVNILNKQSQPVNKGWSSSMGAGEVLTAPHSKKPACYEM